MKLRIPVVHVEAGLRSYNREMPEEHNRVLTDHCADLLFCPSQTAIDHLKKEGVKQGVYLVGDTMYDAVLQFADIAQNRSTILKDLNLEPKTYLLVTVHRPYNTDSLDGLKGILSAFLALDEPVIFPVHPRTRNLLNKLDFDATANSLNLKLISPVGYLDMLMLEKSARMILTDSVGMQKEAYFLRVPCVTLRPEIEWVETVEAGWNVLAGANKAEILNAATNFRAPDAHPFLYGEGAAAADIVRILLQGCAK